MKVNEESQRKKQRKAKHKVVLVDFQKINRLVLRFNQLILSAVNKNNLKQIYVRLGKERITQTDLYWFPLTARATSSHGDQAQEDMEANQQDQEEVEAQIEDAHGGQSPPQTITRSMFKALGARGHLFSLFVISLVEGA